MDKYGIDKINEYSKSLEVLEQQLEVIRSFERMNLFEKYEVNEDYLNRIISTYELKTLISWEERVEEWVESIRSGSLHKDKRPFFVIILKRITRRIERLKKKMSKRFFDYRVQIRTFANKVIRRNTEEDLINVVLKRVRLKNLLQTHINYIWTRNLYWSC